MRTSGGLRALVREDTRNHTPVATVAAIDQRRTVVTLVCSDRNHGVLSSTSVLNVT